MAPNTTLYRQIIEYLSKIDHLDEAHIRVGQDLCSLLGKQYNFGRFVARGGEAIILLAEDTKCGRAVILKVAKPQFNIKPKGAVYNFSQGLTAFRQKETDNEFADRFRRGFLLQQVCHQIVSEETHALGYIPAVFRIEESPGLYCEMEYVPGEMLLAWAKDQEKLEILKTFLRLINFVDATLHAHGFIHSDLKHDNWMILADGRPVLLDFNIAKNLAQQDALTSAETWKLGSILYSSPKQLKSPRSRNVKDDIWTLGLTLWVIWRGHEPHKPALSGDFIDVKKTFPSEYLPRSIARIFDNCIAGEGQGFSSISELRAEIEAVLQQEYAFVSQDMPAPEEVGIEELCKKLDEFSNDEHFKSFVRAVWEVEELKKKLI